MKKLITRGSWAIKVPTRKQSFVHNATLGHVPHVHTRDNKLVPKPTILYRP
jgi:hypothetical protein